MVSVVGVAPGLIIVEPELGGQDVPSVEISISYPVII